MGPATWSPFRADSGLRSQVFRLQVFSINNTCVCVCMHMGTSDFEEGQSYWSHGGLRASSGERGHGHILGGACCA